MIASGKATWRRFDPLPMAGWLSMEFESELPSDARSAVGRVGSNVRPCRPRGADVFVGRLALVGSPSAKAQHESGVFEPAKASSDGSGMAGDLLGMVRMAKYTRPRRCWARYRNAQTSLAARDKSAR